MDFTFTPEQEELREQARAYLAAHPEPTWSELAELGWTGVSVAEEQGGAGLGFLEEAVLFEELGRALHHGPYFSTIALALPALPDDLRAEVAAGEASWTLALGPLVTDLDTAERVAIVGGDGIYELEGARARGPRDDGRDAGRSASSAAASRDGASPTRACSRRSGAAALVALALEACGVAAARARVRDRARAAARAVRQADRHLPGDLAPARGRVHEARARALALALGGVVRGRGRRAGADRRRRGEGVSRPRRRSRSARRAIQVHGGIGFTWEHVLHRLYKRALWIESFLASGTQLRAEVAGARRRASRRSRPAPVSVDPRRLRWTA